MRLEHGKRDIRTSILQPGVNCSGLFQADSGGILIDGRSYYRSFYELAKKAERYILITGWQFDRNVHLLRGDDIQDTAAEVRFIPFLNELCLMKQELEIYILAWDYSMIFALEREWLQELVMNWVTCDRLHFRFDNSSAVGGSHHQKFAVIDGVFAFAGGMDICAGRWDDSRHLAENSDRKDDNGRLYAPYHELQAYLSGPVVKVMVDLFKNRWHESGGGNLQIEETGSDRQLSITGDFTLPSTFVALSETRPQTLIPFRHSVREIENLYRKAIMSAERFIYLENQYFSSRVIYNTFADRMESSRKPPLQIVMILPIKPGALLEEITMGLAQARVLNSLKNIALRKGHSLGIYYTVATSDDIEIPTYIHSKLLIVDDCFLTVGSANTTNRSMGLDSELNVSWETGGGNQTILGESIKNVRLGLLAEHMGIEHQNRLSENSDRVVDYLEQVVRDKMCRLRHHTTNGSIGNAEWLDKYELDQFSFDLGRPIIEESVLRTMSENRRGLFSRGIEFLNNWLFECRLETASDIRCAKAIDTTARQSAMLFFNPVRHLRYIKWGILFLMSAAAVYLLMKLLK
ncbi:MAG TPA: phospholipase D-like domain-containing protein [Syntrophorhabdaceae bacterium]|nr:phospholipase D-like domain-containing protein [Syntrophorhabdaceae bacterium]